MPSRFWKAGGNALLPGSNVFTVTAAASTFWTTANSNWTISGTNNNIATYTASSGWQMVKASAGKTSGNFSVTWTGTLDEVGFGTAATATGSAMFNDPTCVAYIATTGGVYVGGTNVATVAGASAGDTIKAVNSSGSVSFYKNGTLLGTYDATAVGTSLYPVAAANEAGAVVVTADFTNW